MISGSTVAQATPQDTQGHLGKDSLSQYVIRRLQDGMQGAAVARTTGECPCPIVGERIEVAQRVAGKVSVHLQVLSGSGSSSMVAIVTLIPLPQIAGSNSTPCILALSPKAGLHKRLVSARPSSSRRCQLRKHSMTCPRGARPAAFCPTQSCAYQNYPTQLNQGRNRRPVARSGNFWPS
ncbi:dihydrodipicolinate synthase family protein [Pseudomonas sp.]|uniref:dihydrodipicolinate synthase family protein n=1 Tax=Pseudomonas sp. TaxID=306 RepID=UPI003C77DDB6